MPTDPLLLSLLAGFVQEAEEICEKLTRDLLDLERPTDTATTAKLHDRVARGLHTLKGTAATVGLEELSGLAHRLEDVLTPSRVETKSLSSNIIDASLKTLDAFLSAVRSEAEGTPVGAASFSQIRAVLDSLVTTSAPVGAPAVAPVAPALTPTPVPAKAESPATDAEHTETDDGTWRVSVRDVFGLMREIERLREVRLRLELRRRELDEVAARLGRVNGAEDIRATIASIARSLALDSDEAGAIVDSAEEGLKAIGTVPVRTVLEPLRRNVRDLCRQLGKEARLALVGGDVALDRRVLEALKGPLMHLVINATDHGIEMPAERLERGKHHEGSITVRIEQQGNMLFVTVEDDGGGIDADRVRDVALARGLMPAERLASLTATQVQQLIFAAGFSTRSQVTSASGRGVGLDVVKSQVEALDGHVEVQSTRGQGSRFVLTLPVEFGSSPLLAVRVGEYRFGVPMPAVEALIATKRSELRTSKSRTQVPHRDQLLAVHSLSTLLGMSQSSVPAEGQPLLVVQAQGRRIALVVDDVLGDRDLVIRPLPPELRELAAYQGAATLADGELLLVLRADWLIEQGIKGAGTRDLSKRALVVDDSLTARALHRTMLEAGGYTVHTASNAQQALEQLGQALYDVVVCDIGMSGMDGFAFTTALRARLDTRSVPVILVSAHDSEQDRQRGLTAGADGFLSKKECVSGRLLSEVAVVIGRRRAAAS